uniref:carbohydrate sulfotransferase 10-like n=1 Tax=Styela clava TaxID=7725 RepID=UPI0019396B25|nr:carbohydrate sulfotransferase 10-like [Styela clava]
MYKSLVRNVFTLSIFSIVLLVYIYRRSHTQGNHRKLSRTNYSMSRISNLTVAATEESTTFAAKYDWSAAAERFKKRLQTVRRTCDRDLPSKTWVSNFYFLVDVPRRLLVCAVYKAGSTSWHRTFWAIRRKRSNLSTDDKKYYTPDDTIRNQGIAAHLSKSNGLKLITVTRGDDDFTREPPEGSSFRVLLARHPFARFISGWNQKFLWSINYWVNFVKAYKGLLDYRKRIDDKHVMAFEDFAAYAANNPFTIQAIDAHFRPATSICSPCRYDYTYILKAESVDADEPWLKRRLGLEDINVGRRGLPPGGSVVNGDVKNNIKKYMSKLEPSVIKGLYKIYEKDFQFFGYTFNFTTLEAGGFE